MQVKDGNPLTYHAFGFGNSIALIKCVHPPLVPPCLLACLPACLGLLPLAAYACCCLRQHGPATACSRSMPSRPRRR